MSRDLQAWALLHLNDRRRERRGVSLIVRPRGIRLIRLPYAVWKCWRATRLPLWRVVWICLNVALLRVTG